MSDCRTHEYYPYDDGRPCPYCRIEELQRKYDALADAAYRALKNADRLPFVVGLQFEDVKELRALLEEDDM